MKSVKRVYYPVIIFIIFQVSLSGVLARHVVADTKKVESSTTKVNVENDVHSKGKEKVDAVVLDETASRIRKNYDFDLGIVQGMLPLIAKSLDHYYEGSFALTPADENIHAKTIETLADALIENAVAAADRKDWKRFGNVLNITIDLLLIPMNLDIPKEVSYLGAYTFPGYQFRDLQWRPAFSESIVFDSAFKKIYTQSDQSKEVKQINKIFDAYWMRSKDNRKSLSEFVAQYKQTHGDSNTSMAQISDTHKWNEIQDKEKSILLEGLKTLREQIQASVDALTEQRKMNNEK